MSGDSATAPGAPRDRGGIALLLTVGAVLGAGVLRAPGVVAQHFPVVRWSLAVWIGGAVWTLLAAFVLTGLAATAPAGEGAYSHVRRVLGDFTGFFAGWVEWIAACGSAAAIAIVAGEYAIIVLPELRAVELVALLLIASLTVLYWEGLRAGTVLRASESIWKIAAVLAVVAIPLLLGGRNPGQSAFDTELEGSVVFAAVAALQPVLFAFEGWQRAVQRGPQPSRPDVPTAAVLGGIALAAGIAVAMTLAVARVVPIATVIRDPFAGATAIEHLFGTRQATLTRSIFALILAFAVYRPLGCAPRLLFSMSRERIFWRGAQEINKRGVPDVALLLSSMVAAVFVISASFERVVALLAFLYVTRGSFAFVAALAARREVGSARTIAAGLGLALSVAYLACALVSDTNTSLYAMLFMLLAGPLYRLIRSERTAVA